MKIKTNLILAALTTITIASCNTPKKEKENKRTNQQQTTQTWVSEKNRTTKETAEEIRFYDLTKNLQKKYEKDKLEEVQYNIKELKQLLPKYTTNWNYGNAFHKINIIEGRIELQKGNIEKAKEYLILAAKTNGSPQLNSFGPNMSLAKELLEQKETIIVMEYFDLCKKFWKSDYNKLNDWKKTAQNGEIPEFGANLKF